jgi:hypothetical protein
MKILKMATTISFMAVFAFVAINYDHLYSNTVVKTEVLEKAKGSTNLEEALAPAPAPVPEPAQIPKAKPKTETELSKSKSPGGSIMGEVGEGPGFKSAPRKESTAPPDVYKKDPPPPKPVVVYIPAPKPEPDVVTITSKSEYSDYVKGAAGTAVGWAVKEICAFLFGLMKGLFKRSFA